MSATHEDFTRSHPVAKSGNRGFGWTFTTVFLVVAIWPYFSGGSVRWWSLAVAVVLLLMTLVVPALLSSANRAWQRFGAFLNRLTNPLVLAILFYAVVMPIGLLMRAFGKDFLRLRRDDSVESYWIRREPPGPRPDSLPHQF